MMAPVRPYGLIFSYAGGAQKSLRGDDHFCLDRSEQNWGSYTLTEQIRNW